MQIKGGEPIAIQILKNRIAEVCVTPESIAKIMKFSLKKCDQND